MLRSTLLAATMLTLAACTTTETAQAPAAAPSVVASATPAVEDQTAALNAFFEEVDKRELARSPIAQSYRGIKTDYDKWDDLSDAAAIEEQRLAREALAEMKRRFDPARLDAQGKLSYQLFENGIERSTRAFEYRHRGYTFDQMNGAQSQIPAFLINIHKVDTQAAPRPM
jgi:uncharacterized protein (DUF885 family)